MRVCERNKFLEYLIDCIYCDIKIYCAFQSCARLVCLVAIYVTIRAYFMANSLPFLNGRMRKTSHSNNIWNLFFIKDDYFNFYSLTQYDFLLSIAIRLAAFTKRLCRQSFVNGRSDRNITVISFGSLLFPSYAMHRYVR
jgi:hypothetical protein